MYDINEKTHATLNALNEMCDVLMKALPSPHSFWNQVQPNIGDVPDYSAEDIQAARGSAEPIVDEPTNEPAAPAPMPEAPEMDLSQYTPEKLHEILTAALPHIVKILSQGR